MRRLSAAGGLALVITWLAVPLLHLWHATGCESAHHHDDSSCPICQIAAHGTIDHSGTPSDFTHIDAPAAVPVTPPQIAFRPPAPDIRAHGPQGPPSA